MVASQSTSAPLVVVVGATGNQGGSVIKALLESDKEYRLRGLTRDASKPAAQALAKQGVQTHAVTIAEGAQAAVAEAFEGATYVFGVTDFWAHLSLEREVAEGKVIVDAAKSAGATLLWSGLESCKTVSKGKYEAVDHFDGKHEVGEYAKAQGVPTIVVEAGFYASNFTKPQFGPRKAGDDTWVLASTLKADTALPLIDIPADYGLFVRAAIEGGFKPGDELLSVGEWVNFGDIPKIISEATGKTVVYHQLTDDELKAGLAQAPMPPRVQQEVLEMFAFQRDFGYYGGKSTERSTQAIARKPTSFRDFAKQADWSAVLS